MPALFHLNEPLDLSHQYAPPVAQNYSTCELEDLDASMALQTFLASGFLPTQKDDKGATRRGYSMRATEAFACDDFRMYEYKVRRCMRGRSHDWTDCPFTHPGEKARRRDPRKFHYSGAPCPEFRKGSCRRGDACEFAHGVFECWLHPARYRTQACKDGQGCMRRVCFFAHTLQQLRHVGVPVEDSLEERDFMVDAYTHELGLALCDGSSVMVSEGDSPFDVGFMEGLASQNVYADVSNLCEVLSMLALPSQIAVSSPSEAVSTMECPSNNLVGLPSPMFSMDVSGIAQRPSNAFSVMGMAATLHSQLYTPYLEGLSYPKSHDTLHSSYLDGSPLQKPAALNVFLMSGGCDGRGESLLSASAEEFSDMVQYGGYGGDAATQQGYVDVDGLGYGEHEVNEVAQMTQFAALGKEKYEFSNYNGSGSYGLPSPVSTLAGPLCSSPLSSPPLSPLSTSSNEATNGFFMRGRNNLLRDNASWKGDVFTKNMHHMEEIGIKPTFAEHVHHHSQLSACGNVKKLVPLHLRSPSATQCTSGQYKWSPLCDNQSSDDTDKCNFLQRDGQYSNCGEFRGESTAENAMPDLGWVNELVM